MSSNLKRVEIPKEVFESIYNEKRDAFSEDKAGGKIKFVGAQFVEIYKEYKMLKQRECLELDSKTEEKIDILIKMGIEKSKDDVLKAAINFYLNEKKDELKKMIDSL